jgi:SsrA-binding protein
VARGSSAQTKLIADNRRARHEYELLERFEAGLVLTGTEVKSLRAGKASLQHAFGQLRDGDVYLVGANIPEYPQASRQNHDPDRERRLLLHRKEIDRLAGQVHERGLTLVPTRLYFRDGRVKVELALARGKALRDRRRDIAERDVKRQLERALKGRQFE